MSFGLSSRLKLGLAPRGLLGIALANDILLNNPGAAPTTNNAPTYPFLADTANVNHFIQFTVPAGGIYSELYMQGRRLNATNYGEYYLSGPTITTWRGVTGGSGTGPGFTIIHPAVVNGTTVIRMEHKADGFKLYHDGVFVADSAFGPGTNVWYDAIAAGGTSVGINPVVGPTPASLTYGATGGVTAFAATANSYNAPTSQIYFTVSYAGSPNGVEYSLDNITFTRATLRANGVAGSADYRTNVITSPTGLQTIYIRQKDVPANNGTFAVTIPVPAVTLNALTLSDVNYVPGVAESGTISGATASSTITFSALPVGFTINAAARTFAWDGTGAASTPSITLTETLAGATNTPRASIIGLVISAGGANDGLLVKTVSAPTTVNSPAIPFTAETGQPDHFIETPIPANGFTEQRLHLSQTDINNSAFYIVLASNRVSLIARVNGVDTTRYSNSLVGEMPPGAIINAERREGFYKFYINGIVQTAVTSTVNALSLANVPVGTKVGYSGPAAPSVKYGDGGVVFRLVSNSYDIVTKLSTFTLAYTGQPTGYEYSTNGVAWTRAIKVSNTVAGTAVYRTAFTPLTGTNTLYIRQEGVAANNGTFVIIVPALATFGMNPGLEAYYAGERVFKNMLTSGEWQDKDNLFVNVALNSANVNGDGDIISLNGAQGFTRSIVRCETSGNQCVIKYTGTATVTLRSGGPTATATNVVYGSAVGGFTTVTFNYNHDWSSKEVLFMDVTAVNNATPPRNWDCREVGAPAGNGITDAVVARNTYLTAGTRFMDWGAVNVNVDTPATWANRALPDKMYSNKLDGYALEYLCDYANRLNKPIAWFTPHMYASADYLTNYFTFLNNNINANIQIWIQPGNEPDNAAFRIFGYMGEAALAAGRITAAEQFIGGGKFAVIKEHAFQLERMMAILDGMNFPAGRFKRVLSELGTGVNMHQEMRNTYGATRYDIVCNAPYFGQDINDPTAPPNFYAYTEDKTVLFARYRAAMLTRLDDYQAVYDYNNSIGKQSAWYESQQHYTVGLTATEAQQTFYKDLQVDPRMKTLIYDYYVGAASRYGIPIFAYSSSGIADARYGSWGFRPYQSATLLQSPKEDAYRTAIAAIV